MIIQKITEQTDVIRNGLENTIKTMYGVTKNLAGKKNPTMRLHSTSSPFGTVCEHCLSFFKEDYNSITIFFCHFLHL